MNIPRQSSTVPARRTRAHAVTAGRKRPRSADSLSRRLARRSLLASLIVATLLAAMALFARQVATPVSPLPPALSQALKWRNIGPFRGGRVVAVAGIPSDPNLYYFGGVGGGVFKTTNGGDTCRGGSR